MAKSNIYGATYIPYLYCDRFKRERQSCYVEALKFAFQVISLVARHNSDGGLENPILLFLVYRRLQLGNGDMDANHVSFPLKPRIQFLRCRWKMKGNTKIPVCK